jgi:D-xylose transport system ATP-binding protein
MEVADNIAALYLGSMAAQVKSSQVTSGRIVELITSGRSGDLGIQAPTGGVA